MYFFNIIQQALPAGFILLGLGIIFSIVLLVANIKLKVEEDIRVEQVRSVLPGVDCGACGFAGCNAYAKAVVEKPDLIGKCAPGGPNCAAKIADVLNLQMSGGGYAKRPIVHCRANTSDRTYYAKYEGIASCTAANAIANVQACKFGCLGFGDCVKSCKFAALTVIEGLATVNYDKCTGCGACVKACPRNLIEMVPFSSDIMMTVACSSRENGKTTRQMCNVGCIGCGMCVKQGGELFSVNNNLSRIDYDKYQPIETARLAMDKCPTGSIVFRGSNAPAPRSAKL